MFGWTEILLVMLVVLLVFGASRLPEIARSLGSSVNEFKRGLKEAGEEELEEGEESTSVDDSEEAEDRVEEDA